MLNLKGYQAVTGEDGNIGIQRRFGEQLISPSIQALNTNITGFAARHFLMHTQQILSEIPCLSSFPLGT